MRALVTGGAGFIGSHLVDALIAAGHRCTVLDDLSRGDSRNLSHHDSALELVEGSVMDRDLVHDLAPGHDAVFHLASVVGVTSTVMDPSRVIDVAVAGTSNVLGAADRDAAVLVASSSEIYGCSPDVPFDEATPSLIGSPHVARWSYAHAKACAEHLALDAGGRFSRPPTVVRYFNVYGPRMPRSVDPSVVTRFLEAARSGEPLDLYGGGGQSRCFVFVRDAVVGTVAALDRAPGVVVNLGGPTETSIAELASLVVDAAGAGSVVRSALPPDALRVGHEDPQRRSATGQLALELLKWEPSTSLLEGLATTWATWPRCRPR